MRVGRIISTVLAFLLFASALVVLHSCAARVMPDDEPVIHIVFDTTPSLTPVNNASGVASPDTSSGKKMAELGYTFVKAVGGYELFGFSNVSGDTEYRVAGIVNGKSEILSAEYDGSTLTVSKNIVVYENEKFGTPTPISPNENATITDGYMPCSDTDGMFYFIDTENLTVYRRYAAYPARRAAFYPCDNKGSIAPGALSVSASADRAIMQSAPSTPLPTTGSGSIVNTFSPAPTPAATPTVTPTSTPAPTPAEKFFVGDAPYVELDTVEITSLVNINNRLGKDFVPDDLVRVADYIDSTLITLDYENTYASARALQAFIDMMDAAKKDGVTEFYLRNVYRSYSTQQKLWNRRVASDPLYGRTRGEPLGSAYPGSSEHQTGLAFDITSVSSPVASSAFQNTPQYAWLIRNSYKYGFILRYQANKTQYTGIKFEPYHYRYVGEELANELYTRSICLEEYYSEPIRWQ